jgi:peptide/nickel transport system substrate-binding protein
MLYDVAVEALDSLERSSEIKVFTFERPYVHAMFLNMGNELFRSAAFRRQLNEAIDKEALISTALGGHGTPADGPISPHHWARNPNAPTFTYSPKLAADLKKPIHATCIVGESSLERLALTVQQQLQDIGVNLSLESVSGDVFIKRTESADFECAIGTVISGPNVLRPYWVWHSGGPINWGRFRSPTVDAALEHIRHAANDEEYKVGVNELQRAIVEDPPAVFLAWSHRARAVSTRFLVQGETGRDILNTLRQWRPAADKRIASSN